MRVNVRKRISADKLVEMIRSVPLMQRAGDVSRIYVYQDAEISHRHFHPDEVNPTTFYLLRDHLELQQELRQTLLAEHGIDTLHLVGGLELEDKDGTLWTMIPPVIEVTPRHVQYHAQNGELRYDRVLKIYVPIVNDGAHRIMLARELGTTFHGLYITGAREDYPFYAHPNEWGSVRVVDQVPSKREEKKLYSREDCYALYRDFGVIGVGHPRPVQK